MSLKILFVFVLYRKADDNNNNTNSIIILFGDLWHQKRLKTPNLSKI